MTRDPDKGRTLSDLLFLFLQKFAVLRIALTIVGIFVAVWSVAHYSAEPCKPVRLWGLFEYTKQPCNPVPNQPSDTEVVKPPIPSTNEEPEKEPSNNQFLVCWDNGNGCYYLGTETSTSDSRSHIVLDFAEAKWIDADRIIAVSPNVEQRDLEIGDSVFVGFAKNTATWVPATLLKIKGERLHAKLDPAVASTCGIDRQSVSVTVDRILVAAQR